MPKSSKLSSPLPKIWIVEFVTLHSYIPYFLESLEHLADGVRAYEKIEDSGDWHISLHFNAHPDVSDLKEKITELAAAVSLDAPEVTMHEAENKNWVEELSKNFQPIEAGKFYIYSQFSKPSGKLIDLKINPGMAFGTGQHETTYLCLEALQFLHGENFKPENILDLGCGSGILAIGAAKLFNDTVTATDNDPIAVKTAEDNAAENNVALECFTSEGFAIFEDYADVKFDLIFANILMNPLLEMAQDMRKYASGKIILSGFKTEQTEKILEKYTNLGFKSEQLFVKNHWVAMLLTTKYN